MGKTRGVFRCRGCSHHPGPENRTEGPPNETRSLEGLCFVRVAVFRSCAAGGILRRVRVFDPNDPSTNPPRQTSGLAWAGSSQGTSPSNPASADLRCRPFVVSRHTAPRCLRSPASDLRARLSLARFPSRASARLLSRQRTQLDIFSTHTPDREMMLCHGRVRGGRT